MRRFDPLALGDGPTVVAALPPAGSDRGCTVYAGAGRVLTCDAVNARVLEIDVFTGTVTRSVDLDRELLEIAYDWTTDRLYGAADDGGLYRVNLATGITTFISSLPGESPTNWVALTYDDRTQRLIGASQSERRLFLVDPATGAGTPLPEMLGAGLGDVAVDFTDGTIYGVSAEGMLYRISRTNGVAESIGPLPAIAGTASGLAIMLTSDCATAGVLDACLIAAGNASDCNHNALPDACDPDCNGTGIPDTCEALGVLEWDGDGASTRADLAGLPVCLGGPHAPPAAADAACLPTCQEVYDLDADGDVDLADFAAIQAVLGTP